MDGSTAEHSDSDSGESWTLLENTSAYGDDAPDFPENSPPFEREHIEIVHDEDTDGISIITDSDPESSPCDLSCDKCTSEESRPAGHQDTSFILSETLTPNIDNESLDNQDEFLGENNSKHKTYVHRRNKRLSTMLNIIMLGSIITAAGVAIGHMWGARNECTMHTTPSVNKILSNLYKLQEENAFLRNKLKELTLAGNIQLQQRKMGSDKVPSKQHRCRKMFEEPLHNKMNKGFKCIDKPEIKSEQLPEHETEFLDDITKLKTIYHQNKSWLDAAVAKKMKYEEKAVRNMYVNLKNENTVQEPQYKDIKSHRDKNLSLQIGPTLYDESFTVLKESDMGMAKEISDSVEANEKKVSYADSLKSDQPIRKARQVEVVDMPLRGFKDHHIHKKKMKNDDIILSLNSLSEEDFKKDDRYTGPKPKQERKKHDRQKLHKKQKRKNKYEQWEMKGGYLKDYDEFSITSSLGVDGLKNPDKKYLNPDFENYINKFTETDNNQLNKHNKYETKSEKGAFKNDKMKKNKNKDIEWFDKRSALRAEARKKLEHELFGDTSPNAASWYFRRMQKREQCRAQKDNSTFKKFSKHKLNFKMKR